MVEKIKSIPTLLLAKWNSYSSKQKTIIITTVSVVFLMLIILFTVLTRTQYVKLSAFDKTKPASELVDVLNQEKIKNKLSSDGLVVYVDKKKKAEAMQAMNSKLSSSSMNGGFSQEDAFKTTLSTTNDDRNLKKIYILQNDLRNDLKKYEGVRDAVVRISVPVQDYTVFSEEKEPSVSVLLEIVDSFKKDQVISIANHVAGAVGSKTLNNIKISDNKGNLLFSGNDDLFSAGNISSAFDYKEKLINTIKNNLYQVLIKMGYNEAEIGATNVVCNMDKVSDLYTEYTPAEGAEQGLYDTTYTYESKGSSSSGGVPGTDSNGDDTSYNINQSLGTDNTVNIVKNKYLPNKRVVNTQKEIGAIIPEKSSLAIVLVKYKIIKEENLKKEGKLKGISFEEYVSQNSERVKIEVPDDVVNTIEKTTGISTKNISVVAYEQPVFHAKETNTQAMFSNYLMLGLAVLVVLLLLFVVFKSTSSIDISEIDPELSVEQLLIGTRENAALNDIEFGEISEVRRLVEKFINENPEAAAQLLRNWINEDWG